MAEFQVVKLDDMPGFFHKPDWYQPLVFGENISMSVSYLLPGVSITTGSTPESKEFLERAIYMLEGRLDITRDGKKYELLPRMAMLIPLQPGPRVEIKNTSDRTACRRSRNSPWVNHAIPHGHNHVIPQGDAHAIPHPGVIRFRQPLAITSF